MQVPHQALIGLIERPSTLDGFLQGQDLLPSPIAPLPTVPRNVRTKDRQHLVVEHVAVVLDRAGFVLGSLQEPLCRLDQ